MDSISVLEYSRENKTNARPILQQYGLCDLADLKQPLADKKSEIALKLVVKWMAMQRKQAVRCNLESRYQRRKQFIRVGCGQKAGKLLRYMYIQRQDHLKSAHTYGVRQLLMKSCHSKKYEIASSAPTSKMPHKKLRQMQRLLSQGKTCMTQQKLVFHGATEIED